MQNARSPRTLSSRSTRGLYENGTSTRDPQPTQTASPTKQGPPKIRGASCDGQRDLETDETTGRDSRSKRLHFDHRFEWVAWLSRCVDLVEAAALKNWLGRPLGPS